MEEELFQATEISDTSFHDVDSMEDKKEWLNGYRLTIFSFFKIWKIKQAIKNGEKTARNYYILCEWYNLLLEFFNIRQLLRKSLYYALKAIRTDRNYAPAYASAGSIYFGLNAKNKLCETYLLKAIELGGKSFYMPKYILFFHYFASQQFVNAYKIGTKFLNNEFQTQEYWAVSLFIISTYYGYCIEYNRAFKKFFTICINNKEFPNFGNISFIILSIIQIYFSYQSIKLENTGSSLLDALIEFEDYELQLLLSNKLIIRKKHDKHKNNPTLATLYLIKSKALIFKEKQEYKNAMQTLEKFKEYTDDLRYYYYARAQYAYFAYDYENALIYVNEALLNCVDGATLELKGLIYHASKQYENSKDTLITALDYNDCDIGNVNYYICRNYCALGEFNEALKYVNQALLLKQTAQNYFTKAEILEVLGRIKESKECYKKYNELSKV